MKTITLNLSEENLGRHQHFEERLNQLDEKLDDLLFIESQPVRKLNVRKYIDNYRKELKRIEDEENNGHNLISEYVSQINESQDKTKYDNYIKKVIVNRSVGLDEIRSHGAKIEELRRRLALQKQLEKISREEEIKYTNEKLSMSVEYTKKQVEKMKRIIQEESEQKEKLNNAVKYLKKNEFSKIIGDYFKPENLKHKKIDIISNQKSSNSPISSPKPPLKIIPIQNNKQTLHHERSSQSPVDFKPKFYSPVIIKTPLEKKPDYLAEERKLNQGKLSMQSSNSNILSDNKWDKLLESAENSSLHSRIEIVKSQAEMLENKAKQAEKIIKVGGLYKNPEKSEKVSELFIDSIKAKLAILNKINKL
jgi:Txe/YoeB family toxin of Txe-Axe toxin-antitoxin module